MASIKLKQKIPGVPAGAVGCRIQDPGTRLAHPLHPVYDDGKGGGVQWWVKRCKSTCVRTQVARMGADAETLEEH